MTSDHRPNIVFMFSDQHAQRIAGCYGDPVADTPNLARLSRAGVTFDNAYCPSPLCVPSRMATLAGRYPNEIDCRTNHEGLHTDVPTFAHGLGLAGYRTALVGRMHALGPDQTHGFAERRVGDIGATWAGGPQPDLGAINAARGSSGPSFHWSGAGGTSYMRFDKDVTEGALAYLDEAAARRAGGDASPFFLMVGWFLPHHPYIAAPEDYDLFEGRVPPPRLPPAASDHPFIRSWRERTQVTDLPDEVTLRARAAYYGNVRLIDRMAGRIVDRLEALGLAADTLVIYASDHGEQLGERGVWCKSTMYDQSAKVPLIMAWPGGLPVNERRDHVVNLIDLNATLLEAAGAPPLPNATARSLLGVARDPAGAWRNETFSEYYAGLISLDTRPAQHRMVRSGRWKLVYYHGMAPQLFDLAEDPDETRDLAGSPDHAEVRAALTERVLDRWDPDAIARRMAEKEPETRLRRRWTALVRPHEPFRYAHLRPDDNWLRSDRPSDR